MTTYTTTGFSRTVDYETGTYGDFQFASLQTIRQDGAGDFTYHYNWIDEAGTSPQFVNLIDPWSHSVVLAPGGADPVIDLQNGTDFVERLVYAVDWGLGQTAYVLAFFQPSDGTQTIFFIGGDAPVIGDLAGMNAFLANPHRYVLEGAFEGGNAIPLAGFANTQAVEDDVVTAVPDLALNWNAGLGADTVTGGTTNDTLMGGAGDDVLSGGGGADTLMGMTGNDSLTGDGHHSWLIGGIGDDTLAGFALFGDVMQGGAGNDLILMSDGQVMGDQRFSHSHADGGSGQDSIEGGLAGDVAHGGNGDDILNGYEGDDQLEGGNGNDTVNGGTQNDSLSGGGERDLISGGDGRDTVLGGDGNDSCLGGGQNDQVDGGAGQDKVYGNTGADMVSGGTGNDLVQGDAGADTLYGGEGNDTLIGGTEADVLEGEAGADVFRFLTVADGAGDLITDFEPGIDLIDLSRIDAKASVDGNQAFTYVGPTAFTAEGQVRLAGLNGDYWLEVNTSGTAGAEMVLRIGTLLALTATDFVL